jgi:hypothetical protein
VTAAKTTHEAAEALATFCDAWEAGGLPETIAATADAARDGEAPGMRRRKLTVTRLRAVLARNAELEDENARMHTWAGLMSLLDQHYPADVFDGASNDPGPRIVALAREVGRLRDERDAAVAENARMREERKQLTAEAHELRTSLNQNRAARTEWLDLSFGGCDDAAALRAAEARMIETQRRRTTAQTVWMAAAARIATLDDRFAPTKRANAIALESDAAPQQPAPPERCSCGCPKVGDGCDCRFCNEPYPEQPPQCSSYVHPDFVGDQEIRCELPDGHQWHRNGERTWTP